MASVRSLLSAFDRTSEAPAKESALIVGENVASSMVRRARSFIIVEAGTLSKANPTIKGEKDCSRRPRRPGRTIPSISRNKEEQGEQGRGAMHVLFVYLSRYQRNRVVFAIILL